MMGKSGGDEVENGPLWRLPSINSRQLGKIGPAFGLGAGCGFGFGIGIFGGAGLGPGLPGLHLGFGVGVGCGVGLGFGYGVGKGIAYDGNRSTSNLAKLSHRGPDVSLGNEIGDLVDELVGNTMKLVQATSRVANKWRKN